VLGLTVTSRSPHGANQEASKAPTPKSPTKIKSSLYKLQQRTKDWGEKGTKPAFGAYQIRGFPKGGVALVEGLEKRFDPTSAPPLAGLWRSISRGSRGVEAVAAFSCFPMVLAAAARVDAADEESL